MPLRCGALMLCSGARVTSCGAASLGVTALAYGAPWVLRRWRWDVVWGVAAVAGWPGLRLGDPVLLGWGLAVASVGRYVRLESRERSGAGWCGFGRRDALGGSGVSSGPSGLFSAAYRRAGRRVRPCVRRVCGLACGVVLCFPHERGRAGALLRAPVVAESGRRAVCRCCGRAFPTLRRDAAVGRCLLSNRMLRVSSSARIATSFGPSRRRPAVPVETCR